MPRQAFISHASVDADLAQTICRGLESRHVSCWIAPRDVPFNEDTYGPEIERALHDCHVVLIVVTDTAAESAGVEREAVSASEYGKRIIPLLVGRRDAGRRLKHYVAGRQFLLCPPILDEAFLDGLASIIKRDPTVADTPKPAVRSPSRPRRPSRARGPLRALAVIVVGIVLTYATYRILYYLATRPRPTTSAINRSPEQPPITPTERPKSPQTDGQTTKPRVTRESSPPASTPSRPDPSAKTTTPTAATTTAARGSTTANLNGVSLTFVSIPGGSFRMGCAADDRECEDDETVRQMVVDPFEISATEVTQDVWTSVMGKNPSDFQGDALPVEHVSWQDAHQFLDTLNARRDGYTYRLPTEAEWEYAARANGTRTPDLKAVAWFELLGDSSRAHTQRVASKQPNGWGLYDMQGNVAEWCEEWYSPNYQRVIRGGAWTDTARSLRLSARGKAQPGTREYSIGVRLVRTRH